jgi:hypothetical protein
MSKNTYSFGEILRGWLETRHLTPRQAAGTLGVSHMTIYNWMAGNLPPKPRVPSLAIAFGMAAEDLVQIVDRARVRAHQHGPKQPAVQRGGHRRGAVHQLEQVSKRNRDSSAHATIVASGRCASTESVVKTMRK